jgi:hypothetical protein
VVRTTGELIVALLAEARALDPDLRATSIAEWRRDVETSTHDYAGLIGIAMAAACEAVATESSLREVVSQLVGLRTFTTAFTEEQRLFVAGKLRALVAGEAAGLAGIYNAMADLVSEFRPDDLAVLAEGAMQYTITQVLTEAEDLLKGGL